MSHANYIAESMLAITCGLSIHLGIFSIFFALFAKTSLEKFGFLLCAIIFLALLLLGVANTNLSFWILLCYFVGFAIASIATSNQNTLIDAPQILDTKKMSKASKRAGDLYLIMLAVQSLILLSGLFVPARSAWEVSVALSLLFVFVAALSVATAFLSNPSRLACFVSLLITFGLVLLSLIPFGKILEGRNNAVTSVELSLCAGIAIFFWYYACAISKLTPHELLLTTPAGRYPIHSLKHHLARPGVKTANAILSWGCDIASRLVLGFHGFFKLFTVGALVYLFCFFPWLLLWSERERVSWDSILQVAGMILSLHIVLVAGVVACSLTSHILKRCSRLLSRASYLDTIEKDCRPPILFLRTFSNDQGKLPSVPLFQRIWSGDVTHSVLDYHLVEQFSSFGPVVALGAPGEDALPFGASRLYVGKDDDWMKEVTRLAEESLAVIVICAHTDSVIKEINELSARNLLHKVLLLADPQQRDRGLESLEETKQVVAHSPGQIAVGYYQVGDTSRTYVCNEIASEDYAVCCNAFLTELISPDRLARAFDRLVTV